MILEDLRRMAALLTATAVLVSASSSLWAAGAAGTEVFSPNNLIVTRSVYQSPGPSLTPGVTVLPPGCVSGKVEVPLIAGGDVKVTIPADSSSGCTVAGYSGAYPDVFYNDSIDGSFAVAAPIFLDQMSTGGALLNTLAIDPTQIVTSFESKSELAVNLSTDGQSITFGGYVGGPGFPTQANDLDISNSNTPGLIDPTNPDVGQYYRAVAEVDAYGNLTITDNNAYSGDNGRAVVKGNGLYYRVGNDNNGGLSKTQLTTTIPGSELVTATGAELVVPGQTPPAPPNGQIGEFSITQVGYSTADKPGKDDNFRGMTIFNNTLYVSKGSGGNGINTVYQVGTAGTLPTPANAPGGSLLNVPITILPGFPTVLASGTNQAGTAGLTVDYPFGMWFANANTLYVADEGDGNLVSPPVNGNVADAADFQTAGLQKWVLNSSTGTWQLAYILQNGLNIGVPYSITNGPNGEIYPPALYPATGGLRNITGRVNADGTVSLWAITSTVSANGDMGADPNQLVTITDVLANTNPAAAANERFSSVETAGYGELLRGVCFTPGTVTQMVPQVPVTTSAFVYSRVSKTFNGTITITNNSDATVSGPMYVLLENLPAGVTLNDNPPTIMGYPAVLMLPSGSTLIPGQSVSMPVSFTDPSMATISFTGVAYMESGSL